MKLVLESSFSILMNPAYPDPQDLSWISSCKDSEQPLTHTQHQERVRKGPHGSVRTASDVEHITLELFQNGILLNYELG